MDVSSLQRNVVDWLNGKVLETPWYLGLPAKETEEIRHHLIRVNSVPGIVTTGSQPAYRGLVWSQRAALGGLATDEGIELLQLEAVQHKLFLLVRPTNSEATFEGCPVITTKFGRTMSMFRTFVVKDMEHAGLDISGLTGFVITTDKWVGSSRLWDIFSDDE